MWGSWITHTYKLLQGKKKALIFRTNWKKLALVSLQSLANLFCSWFLPCIIHRLKWTLKFTHRADRLKIYYSLWELKFTSDVSYYSLISKECICYIGLWFSSFRFTAHFPNSIQLFWIFSETNKQAQLSAVPSAFPKSELCIWQENQIEK